MAVDYTKLATLLKGHNGAQCRPRDIQQADLLAKAKAMAQRGYAHTTDTLRVLEAYMQGYGILLSGGIGIGKSFFFETVNPEPVAVLSFNRCHLWRYEQLEQWLDDHTGVEVVLDDIGWDADKANNYGTKYEVLQVVLDHRLTESGCRTHITTNLSTTSWWPSMTATWLTACTSCASALHCRRVSVSVSRNRTKPTFATLTTPAKWARRHYDC